MIASFVLATGLSEYRQRAIDHRVDEMVTNAMPSVQQLAAARTALRRLDDALVDSLASGPPPDAERWRQIESLRRALDPPLGTYRALPFFPAEQRMFDTLVPARLAELDAALQAHRLPAAHRAMGRLDEGLHQLVDFNAAEGQRLGVSIQQVRQQSMEALLGAELLTIVLAAVGTVIAIRNHRRTVALLAERARELEDFAGRVAHDLRGPLNSMAMRLQLSERQQKPLPAHLMEQYVRRMTAMIDALLDFARAGARPQPGEHADVGGVVKETVAALTLEAEQAGVMLAVESEASAEVACAPGMVTSVVANLARNALKYVSSAHRLHPRVDLRVRKHADHVRVEVEDNGPGIPLDAQESIFKPFVRLSSDQPGIGLGLATVKRIVESHGGQVGVDSTPGIGSCFWFELPA